MTIGTPDGHFLFRHFLTIPSFPTRSRIPPVILSERSESKDLLKDIRPATRRCCLTGDLFPQADEHNNLVYTPTESVSVAHR